MVSAANSRFSEPLAQLGGTGVRLCCDICSCRHRGGHRIGVRTGLRRKRCAQNGNMVIVLRTPNHAFESGRAEERRVLGLPSERRAAQRERWASTRFMIGGSLGLLVVERRECQRTS